MNPKEILRADLLDILFDNRNKSYGAYTLRKFYDGRLMKATGIGLGVILSICLFIHLNDPAAMTGPIFDPKEEVKLTEVEIPVDKPVVPEATPVRPQQPAASRMFTNNIRIVDSREAFTDIPTMEELDKNIISNIRIDGPELRPGTDPYRPAEGTKSLVVDEQPEAGLLQRQPEFPGGKEAWSKFLSRWLTVPGELEAGEKRTVLVRFLVSEDGSITSFTVIQSGGKAFDNEVIRVLKKMPKWNPAVQNGRNVAVTFTQPVTFQAVEE